MDEFDLTGEDLLLDAEKWGDCPVISHKPKWQSQSSKKSYCPSASHWRNVKAKKERELRNLQLKKGLEVKPLKMPINGTKNIQVPKITEKKITITVEWFE